MINPTTTSSEEFWGNCWKGKDISSIIVMIGQLTLQPGSWTMEKLELNSKGLNKRKKTTKVKGTIWWASNQKRNLLWHHIKTLHLSQRKAGKLTSSYLQRKKYKRMKKSTFWEKRTLMKVQSLKRTANNLRKE